MSPLIVLLGCAHLSDSGPQRSVHSSPESAVIGWRLVPGQELSYSHTVRLVRGTNEVSRTEHWSYLVREVDEEGSALLEGRLTGLGALIQNEGELARGEGFETLMRNESDRISDSKVWVTLSIDGRILAVDGLDWSEGLVHRALGLNFPADPVEPGSVWPDPESIAPFRSLVPAEVAILPSVQAGVVTIYEDAGGVFADIEMRGSIVAGGDDVPKIEMQGEATWDLVLGQLVTRSQRLSLSQYNEPFGGLLLIKTERLL